MTPADAEICVHILPKSCERVTLCVSSTRTDAVARMLSRLDNQLRARRMITLLYGLCPAAHLAAFDGALSAACGEPLPEPGSFPAWGLLESAALIEAIAENLRVLVLEAARLETESAGLSLLPADLLPPPAHLAEAARPLGAARALIAGAVSDLSRTEPEKIPSEAADRIRGQLAAALNQLGDTARRSLLGAEPEAYFAAADSAAFFAEWAARHAGASAAAHLLLSFLAEDPADPAFPGAELPMLPEPSEKDTHGFGDELCYRMLHDPGFDLAPFWRGSPRLTGAAARLRNHPAILDLRMLKGTVPSVLLAARILETAKFFSSARAALSGRPEALSRLRWHYAPGRGSGLSLVETGRGLLAHAAQLDAAGKLAMLKITSPTEWQFSPNGPGQQLALPAVRSEKYPADNLGRARLEMKLRRALFPLDACVPITFAYNGASAARRAEMAERAAQAAQAAKASETRHA